LSSDEATDYHNMILFLERDTSRKYPVGLEDPRRNIFDPLDSPQIPFIEPKKNKSNGNDGSGLNGDRSTIYGMVNPEFSGDDESHSSTDIEPSRTIAHTGRASKYPKVVDDDMTGKLANNGSCSLCVRPCCTEKRRFDSLFCSDGCGVASMELDLLRSLQSYISSRHKLKKVKSTC
jgi:hypothetical protein